MEPLTGLAVVSGAGLLFALLRWGSREKQRTWRRAARAAGVLVHGDERAFGFFQGLTGQVEAERSLTIRIWPVKYGTHITVSGLAGVEALRLASEGLTERVFGQHDPRIGDDAFDAAVVIGGPIALAQAALDSHTRAALLRLFAGAITFDVWNKPVRIVAQSVLTEGRLELSLMNDLDGERGERLEAVLRLVLDAAVRLAAPRDVPRALAANAAEDPLPGVRRESVRTLSRAYGHLQPAFVAGTLQRACDDPDDSVALVAALGLGMEGHPTLLRLASASRDEQVAAIAIRKLRRALPSDRAAASLESALRDRHFEKALAALDALDSLASFTDAAAAAVEPLLVTAVASGPPALVEAAARLLGRVGSAAAVLPLQEAATRHGPATRATALWAKDAIQARLRGATPGQVSLAGGEAGEVSIADDASGRVSVDEK